MMRQLPRIGFVSALTAMLLLGGCSDGRDDLRAYIDRINARPGQGLEPLPEVTTYEPYVYREDQRRNPFEPIESRRALSDNRGSELQPDTNRPAQPLEAFPLDALQMVGLVELRGRRFALIKDPEGIIHRVAAGSYAGQNYGRITAIEAAAVRLTEVVPDGFGGWTERPATIALAE